MNHCVHLQHPQQEDGIMNGWRALPKSHRPGLKIRKNHLQVSYSVSFSLSFLSSDNNTVLCNLKDAKSVDLKTSYHKQTKW